MCSSDLFPVLQQGCSDAFFNCSRKKFKAIKNGRSVGISSQIHREQPYLLPEIAASGQNKRKPIKRSEPTIITIPHGFYSILCGRDGQIEVFCVTIIRKDGKRMEGQTLSEKSEKMIEAILESYKEYPVTVRMDTDRKSTRLNSSHMPKSRMPSSA